MVRWRFSFIALLCLAVALSGDLGLAQDVESVLATHLESVLPVPCALPSSGASSTIELIPEEHNSADAKVREMLSKLADAPNADFLLALEFASKHSLSEGSVVSGLAVTFRIAKIIIPRILSGKPDLNGLAFFLDRLSETPPKNWVESETSRALESWKAKRDTAALSKLATTEGLKFFEDWFQSYLKQAKLQSPDFPFGDGGNDPSSIARFNFWENGFWRSRAMAEGVLKSFCAARQTGKSVRAMMGASHVPIVYKFLSNSLKGQKVVFKTDRPRIESSLVKWEKASASGFSFESAVMRRLTEALP